MDSASAFESSGLFSREGFAEAMMFPAFVESAALARLVRTMLDAEKPVIIPKALKVKSFCADIFHCLRMISVSPKVRCVSILDLVTCQVLGERLLKFWSSRIQMQVVLVDVHDLNPGAFDLHWERIT